jgi:phage-related holin
MLTVIRIIGLGIWAAVLSMAISAFFFGHGTEADVTLVFVAIMDFIVIVVAARGLLKICRHQRD